MSNEQRYAPIITKTDGWYRNLNDEGKLLCGWCLPAHAALVHQAEPARRYLTTRSGDFYVLQDFQVVDLTPEEIQPHRACAE